MEHADWESWERAEFGREIHVCGVPHFGGTTAITTDLKAEATKTPVSVLQELCTKLQIFPKYDLIQVKGSPHKPTFKYRVTVGKYVEQATGQSKKKAKQAAARAVLDLLEGTSDVTRNAEGVGTGAGEGDKDNATAGVMPPYEDGIPGNPVGALQEICMSRRLPPPVYEVSAEDGLPHDRWFTIECVVGKNQASGAGKSKKIAKRLAAHKLVLILKESQPDQSQGVGLLDDDNDDAQARSCLIKFENNS